MQGDMIRIGRLAQRVAHLKLDEAVCRDVDDCKSATHTVFEDELAFRVIRDVGRKSDNAHKISWLHLGLLVSSSQPRSNRVRYRSKADLPPRLFRLYNVAMKSANPPGVGLGGDGDEIAAVERVEADFGVKLDVSTASTWLTAGDVYRALLKELPAGAGDTPETWSRFVRLLAEETGGDPNLIEQDSLLLGAASGSTTIAVVTAAIIVVALAVSAVLIFR
jgi:hypothetical protein